MATTVRKVYARSSEKCIRRFIFNLSFRKLCTQGAIVEWCRVKCQAVQWRLNVLLCGEELRDATGSMECCCRSRTTVGHGSCLAHTWEKMPAETQSRNYNFVLKPEGMIYSTRGESVGQVTGRNKFKYVRAIMSCKLKSQGNKSEVAKEHGENFPLWKSGLRVILHNIYLVIYSLQNNFILFN